ncbi:hypothetical protein NEA10_11280 [Phormidium yuhuli AB48]|uniref:Uncharacterized protein n=1 Tax=Phormidium yuhuli AB48 TaxID=2940671 RepID=A0ABY5AJX8_9CYAN|nr:hypothetical protein [Phormidium yuhuli]USR89474.1 hypothetical protein NEA10_11280 [Phormidium yuhuli AB48]
MDSVQDQILTLNSKVDGLYETIERLNLKLSQVLEQNSSAPPPEAQVNTEPSLETPLIADTPDDWGHFMQHKDVLGDESRSSAGQASPEANIAPEVQIQRLTAQLTAAYNRIAALEEQLLSRTDFAQRKHHLIQDRQR